MQDDGKDSQSSRTHSRLIPILTYVLRENTIVVIDRQIDTQSAFHFESDSGLTKFDVCP